MRILFVVLSLYCAQSAACVELNMAMNKCPVKSSLYEKNGRIVTDDLFMLKLTDDVLSWNRIKEMYDVLGQKIISHSVPSVHDPELLNNVYIVNNGIDFLSFYSGVGNTFPLCVVIKSEKNNSKSYSLIGKPLSYFQGVYGFNESVETLTIDTIEGDSVISLNFKNGKVSSFTYRTDYLD
jgi:hypothetical protein